MTSSAQMLEPTIEVFVSAHQGDDDEHLAQALTTHAAQLASQMRREGLTTYYKTSVSDVVTQADRTAEKFIVHTLEQLRPHDGILAEEGSHRLSSSGRSWVIDPVDGTYNFTLGSDYWCCALALVENAGNLVQEHTDAPMGKGSAPVVRLGAVHRPAMKDTWLGGPDIPTRKNDGQLPSLSDASPEKLCLGTYLHPTFLDTPALREPWERVARMFASWRMLGAGSVDLAHVAQGSLGAWMQHSVPAWDWLPGQALVEGAGGTTLQVEAGGVTWSIAGNRRAVHDIAQCLG